MQSLPTLTVCTLCAGHTRSNYFIIHLELLLDGLPQLTSMCHQSHHPVTYHKQQQLLSVQQNIGLTVKSNRRNGFSGVNRIEIIFGESECTIVHQYQLFVFVCVFVLLLLLLLYEKDIILTALHCVITATTVQSYHHAVQHIPHCNGKRTADIQGGPN